MGEFAHDGITTYYERKGNGRPLMLVAGLAADNAFWMPSVDALAARYDLLIPDNRGAGRTTPLDTTTSIRAMADDCIALADHVGVAKFAIAGHSMGGMIAQDCAIRYPGRIERLVLASSTACASAWNNDLFATWSTLFRVLERQLWFRNLFYWVLSPAFLDNARSVDALVQLAATYPYQQTPVALANQVKAIAGFDARAQLSSIAARTLVMAGTRDIVFRIEDAAAFAKSIPYATFAPIEGAAHSFPIEAPKDFTQRVLDFLE
jgi:pimeloyl-ACP methyl ester carboxylesterase